MPSFAEERLVEKQGYSYIAGIDEVGRGALAGPVVAAAVILPLNIRASWLKLVNVSKQLSPAKREFLFSHINKTAIAVGVGQADCEVIDRYGIVKATQLAMMQAIEHLSPSPETLLIDYMLLPEVKLTQKGVTYGDRRCLSIACASIVAKVMRDRLMMELEHTYPGYDFFRHKGYGTRRHIDCLHKLGPSPIHRRSFRPVCHHFES